MSIASVLLGLSLLILVGLILARPFLAQQEREPRPRSRKQQLLMQKEALLAEIGALDFEYETGTLPEDAYQAQRAELVAVAAETLQALDELGADAPAGDVAAQIEAALNRVRMQRQAPGQATAVPQNGQAQFCTECGAKIDASDKFCAACGSKRTVPA